MVQILAIKSPSDSLSQTQINKVSVRLKFKIKKAKLYIVTISLIYFLTGLSMLAAGVCQPPHPPPVVRKRPPWVLKADKFYRYPLGLICRLSILCFVSYG